MEERFYEGEMDEESVEHNAYKRICGDTVRGDWVKNGKSRRNRGYACNAFQRDKHL